MDFRDKIRPGKLVKLPFPLSYDLPGKHARVTVAVALKETRVDFVATREIFYSSRRDRSVFYPPCCTL
jgi:hypothetical protein